jgi:hypothetical protein
MIEYPSILNEQETASWIRQVTELRNQDVADWNNLSELYMRGRKTEKTPASSTDTTDCKPGDFNYDSDYFYICVEDSGSLSWRKIPLMLIENAYEDIPIPATAINPTGAASPPGIDTADGGYFFDSASTEVISIITRMPHTWAEGTDITFRVHWTKTTSAAGNVYWRLEYKWAPINEVYDSSWTTLNQTAVIASVSDTNTANKHLISEFSSITTTGKERSDNIIVKLSRIGGDASDTYGADARLLACRVRFQSNAWGARTAGGY